MAIQIATDFCDKNDELILNYVQAHSQMNISRCHCTSKEGVVFDTWPFTSTKKHELRDFETLILSWVPAQGMHQNICCWSLYYDKVYKNEP